MDKILQNNTLVPGVDFYPAILALAGLGPRPWERHGVAGKYSGKANYSYLNKRPKFPERDPWGNEKKGTGMSSMW